MKYIDAEKLLAEIERRKKQDITFRERNILVDIEMSIASLRAEMIITSLQQEQPKFKIGDTIHKIGENTVFPMTIERISDGDYVCDGGKCFVSIKFQDDYELIEQEQPGSGCSEKPNNLLSEWTEEDERTRWNLCSLLTNLRVGKKIEESTFKKYYSWLKIIHIKPRKTRKQEQSELDVDTLREWSMLYAPDIRPAIESTAYHFWNKALNAGKEE